ncbi:DUF4350 domain-containing protein [Microbacterium sp. BG28]|uniref:DUF4350 domain-containing protein n=1 Tax=Microbacterium sp. BG28 TaxID=3097356 RepID=UPI002A5A1039|nr:DUF4350 domain-containing protein [Microbacterium sp. BG28]MDY0830386.1 DUF4350 domain-containing protein [Microbacterium sp. BG28]
MSVRPRPARARTWAVIGAAIIVVGIIGAVVSANMRFSAYDRFDPDDPGPDGMRALARILSEQGIDVVVTRDIASAEAALREGESTLVLPDSPLLSDAQLTSLADAADSVVVSDPRARSVRLLFDGRIQGYGTAAAIAADCDLPVARRAGAVSVGATFAAPDAVGCYPVDDAFGLLWEQRGDSTLAAVDGSILFTNEHLASDGNAALALGLLGAHDRLVWLVPALSAGTGATGATLGELTPPWVTPAIVLLGATALAAAIWRGRRFGPLVHERLPVTVRADETTRGLGRLYARAGARDHAAALLRGRARDRAATALSVPHRADAAATADAVAAATGIPPARSRALLGDEPVADDRSLARLAADLRALEARLTPSRPRKESQ